MSKITNLVIAVFLLVVCRVDAAQWFAATNGTVGGSGSILSPFELQTAFSKVGIIVAGDTLNLRGGVYSHIPQGESGVFGHGWVYRVEFNGSVANQIIVQPYQGERVIIDGSNYVHGAATARPTLQVGSSGNPTMGSYVTIKDLEIASLSTETRVSTDTDPCCLTFPQDLFRSDGVMVHSPGAKVINCVIYDTATGLSSFGTTSSPEEYYGNIIFSCGWRGSDRPHGHGMYLQNTQAGTNKWVSSNTVFNVYENGMQYYGTSGNAEIFHFRVLGNTIANNVFIFGGQSSTAQGDDQIRGNFQYNSVMAYLYHFSDLSTSMEICNNYIGNGYMQGGAWASMLMTNNTIVGNTRIQDLVTQPFCAIPTGWTVDRNTYVAPTLGSQFFVDEGCGGFRNFTNWQSHTGFDLNSTMNAPMPTTNLVVLQPNLYDTNRATVIAYNWSLASTISKDISSLGWAVTDQIRVRANSNWENDITTNSIPGQIITLPMSASLHPVAIPRGASAAIGPQTFPQFGSFSLYRIVGATPTPTNIITIASTNASGAVVTATADLAGNTSGTTTFTRSYLQGTPVSFTAPATLTTNNFSFWAHAGTNFSSSTTIAFNVASDETYTATYIAPPATVWTNNITSVVSSSVTITNFPADNAAVLSGVTPYTLRFNDGIVFALTAPSTASGNPFKFWRRNGVPVTTKTEVTTTANSAELGVNPSSFVAEYNVVGASSNTVIVLSTNASAVTITVTPSDLGGNGAGSTPFSRTYSTFTSATLTSPSTASGKNFVTWRDENGTAVSDSPGSVNTTFFLNVPRTRIAEFSSAPAPQPTNSPTVLKSSARRRGVRR